MTAVWTMPGTDISAEPFEPVELAASGATASFVNLADLVRDGHDVRPVLGPLLDGVEHGERGEVGPGRGPAGRARARGFADLTLAYRIADAHNHGGSIPTRDRYRYCEWVASYFASRSQLLRRSASQRRWVAQRQSHSIGPCVKRASHQRGHSNIAAHAGGISR